MPHRKAVFHQALRSLQAYFPDLRIQTDKLIALFYQGKRTETKEEYEAWLEGVQSVVEVALAFASGTVPGVYLPHYQQLAASLYEKTHHISTAWYESTTTEMGDLLQYEWLLLLEHLEEEIQNTMKEEGVRPDVH